MSQILYMLIGPKGAGKWDLEINKMSAVIQPLL
jgi:hypothetical protein